MVRANRRAQGRHLGQRVRRRAATLPVPSPPRSDELRAGTCSCTGQGVDVPALHLQPRRCAADPGLASSHRGRFIWAAMLRTLILVLYCTGMRLGEAVRLRTADVDLDRGILKVQHSKGRSRVVAIRPDLVAELRRYGVERQKLLDKRRRHEPEAFFLRLDASPLNILSASRRSAECCDNWVKPPSGTCRRAPVRVSARLCRPSAHGLGGGRCRYPRQATVAVGVSRSPEHHRDRGVFEGDAATIGTGQRTVRAAPLSCAAAAMTRTANGELFALVESFFIEYLPRQRGASSHTIRAYRDTLKLLFEFIAQRLDARPLGAGARGSRRERDRCLSRSHRGPPLELCIDAQLPACRHPQLLQASLAQ